MIQNKLIANFLSPWMNRERADKILWIHWTIPCSRGWGRILCGNSLTPAEKLTRDPLWISPACSPGQEPWRWARAGGWWIYLMRPQSASKRTAVPPTLFLVIKYYSLSPQNLVSYRYLTIPVCLLSTDWFAGHCDIWGDTRDMTWLQIQIATWPLLAAPVNYIHMRHGENPVQGHTRQRTRNEKWLHYSQPQPSSHELLG